MKQQKRDKERQKKEKERERLTKVEDRNQQREAAKLQQANLRLANELCTKVSATKSNLETCITNVNFSKLPLQMQETSRTLLTKLSAVASDTSIILAGNHDHKITCISDSKDGRALLADAKHKVDGLRHVLEVTNSF